MSAANQLLIDAGNTRIKWALMTSLPAVAEDPARRFDGGVRGDCLTGSVAELACGLSGVGKALDSLPEIEVVYCSVAGEEVNAQIETQMTRYFQHRLSAIRRFFAVPKVGPMINGYRQPGQLGADRLAAALGAWQRTRGDVVVVSAGTATTIDIVRKEVGNVCRFSGGVILPGLDLMIGALASRTAGLPLSSGAFHRLPDNTDDAITTGCLLAQTGAIERMRRLLPAGTPCLLAGGAARRLRPLLDSPVIDAPDLVLEGLAAAILHGFDR